MSQFWINFIFVIGSFIIYTAIAVWARAKSTREFYIAGGEVNPVMNGMATAADWLSAASFISVAGLISVGYVNSSFIMGWTGGYVLLATLLAPYMRRFGAYCPISWASATAPKPPAWWPWGACSSSR